MKLTSNQVKSGDSIVYNDGRQVAVAAVLSVNPVAMLVQFDDRADTTTIRFSDSAWMDYITIKH